MCLFLFLFLFLSAANSEGINAIITKLSKLTSTNNNCHSQVKANIDTEITTCQDECTKLMLAISLANCMLEHQNVNSIRCDITSNCMLEEGCLIEQEVSMHIGAVISPGNKKIPKLDKPTQQSMVFAQAYSYIDETCVLAVHIELLENNLMVLRVVKQAIEESLDVVRNIEATGSRTHEVN